MTSAHTFDAQMIAKVGTATTGDGEVPAAPRKPSVFDHDRLPLERCPAELQLPRHIPSLDGIRGLAVLLVLFCHATQRPFTTEQANELFNSSIDKGFLSIARLAWSGVDLFFVLSGFLITGILYDAKGKPHFFKNFYARRTVRIFPLYYSCLILYLVIFPLFGEAFNRGMGELVTSRIWYPLYLSNYAQSIAEQSGQVTHHVLHVTWSLSIEEQFYLCWPMVVFFFGRKTLLKICVGMFFGSMALRTGLLAFDKWFWAMGFTPCRVDGLAVGAAIALVARGPRGIWPLVKPAKWLGPVFAVMLLAMIALMTKYYHRGIGQSPGYVIAGTALISLAYGSLLTLVAAAQSRTLLGRTFESGFLRLFGKYSYAIYLLHLPIMVWINNYVYPADKFRVHNSLIPSLIIFYAITWTLSVVAALLSWNLLEKHFLKLKDRFPMEKKADTATAWEGADVAVADPAPVGSAK